MFTVLRSQYADRERKLVNVRRSNKPRTRGPHLACTACHSKKVKCSGGKDGCDRCKARSMQCVYVKQSRAPSHVQEGGADIHPIDPPGQYERDIPRSPSGVSRSQDDSSESDLPRMSNSLLNAEAEVASGQATAAQNPMPVPADWASWSNPVQSVEDWISPTGTLELSLDSGHGIAAASVNGTLGLQVEPNICMESDDSRSSHAQEAWGLGEFFNFGYNTGTLPEETSTMEWEIPSATPQHDTCRLQNKPGTNTVDHSSGLSHIVGPCVNYPLIASPASTSVASSTSSSTCQCTQKAMQVLEALQIDSHTLIPSAFDRILGLKKQTIDDCTSLLECQTCVASSAFVMLLIVICEKLVVSFEAWSTRYKGRNPSATRRRESEDEHTGNAHTRKFYLGVYEVTLEEERCSLLRALAMVQLRRLIQVIGRLTSVATSQDWAAHRALLNSFSSRLQGAAVKLQVRF